MRRLPLTVAVLSLVFTAGFWLTTPARALATEDIAEE